MSRKYRDSRHHRKPKSCGGFNDNKNISLVDVIDHRSWHRLFGTTSPQEICRRINSIWLDPDWKFSCIPAPKLPQ